MCFRAAYAKEAADTLHVLEWPTAVPGEMSPGAALGGEGLAGGHRHQVWFLGMEIPGVEAAGAEMC